MRDFKTTLIWICFITGNLLALIGFAAFDHQLKTVSDILLSVSLLFTIGFIFISINEIIVSSKFSKSEKVLWPILIIVLSIFGQIAYLVLRKKRN